MSATTAYRTNRGSCRILAEPRGTDGEGVAGVWLIEGSCGPESALEGDESQRGALSEAENEKAAQSASPGPAPEVRGAQGTASEDGDAAGGHAGAGETAPDADALPFHLRKSQRSEVTSPTRKSRAATASRAKIRKMKSSSIRASRPSPCGADGPCGFLAVTLRPKPPARQARPCLEEAPPERKDAMERRLPPACP